MIQSGSAYLLLSTLHRLETVEIRPIYHINGEEQDIALHMQTALGTAVL